MRGDKQVDVNIYKVPAEACCGERGTASGRLGMGSLFEGHGSRVVALRGHMGQGLSEERGGPRKGTRGQFQVEGRENQETGWCGGSHILSFLMSSECESHYSERKAVQNASGLGLEWRPQWLWCFTLSLMRNYKMA